LEFLLLSKSDDLDWHRGSYLRLPHKRNLNPMPAKVRDRIVNFRLSQEEYRILQEASAARGARNISDFTRSEVLAFLKDSATLGEQLTRRFALIEAQIATMQCAIAHLNSGLRSV
jgi:uncharacterized protein (DUF1778 family)